jgi:putative glutamine amidotransferase
MHGYVFKGLKQMKNTKPIIGLTLDLQTKNTYSEYPWYALRQNYAGVVSQFGGMPFPLSYDVNLIDDYLKTMQGLIITGGSFDIDPHFYGEEIKQDNVHLNQPRTVFEKTLLEKALAKDIPILGICGGEQLLNVVLGGTLIQDIAQEIPHALNHHQESDRHKPCHDIHIQDQTLLHQWFGESTAQVNTSHHQAVKDLGRGIVVNAVSPDGVVEGIEVPEHKFCLGVQWHPEFLVSPLDHLIMKKFIDAAQGQ